LHKLKYTEKAFIFIELSILEFALAELRLAMYFAGESGKVK
jgi:hypothetical protein